MMSGKTRKQFTVLCLLLLSIFFSSCSFVIEKMMGIRSAHPLTEKEHRRFLKKLGAASDLTYYADSSYLSALNKLYPDSSQHHQMKNHYQPIQVLYFGHSSLPSFSMINCYAGGFPKLNWNEDGRFDTFPPINGSPVDTIFTLERLLKNIKPYNGSNGLMSGQDEPYTVVLYWCRWNFRESKRLHRLVKENLAKTNEPWRILYVNTDRYIAGE